MARMKPNDPRCPLCLKDMSIVPGKVLTCDRVKCAYWRLGFDTKTFDSLTIQEINHPDTTPPRAKLA